MIKNYKKILYACLVIFSFFIFGVVAIKAALNYQSNPNTEITIDEHSVCKKVENTGGANTYFIPTKTAAEWTSFRNAADTYLADINLNSCCVANNGELCGGNVCVNSGTINCEGTCVESTNKQAGTNCGAGKVCDGSGNCISSTPTFSGSGSCAGKGSGDVQRVEGTSNQLRFYADDGGGASMLCATIGISGTSFSYSLNGGPYQDTGMIFRSSGVFISNLTDSTIFTFWAEPSNPGNNLKIKASGGVTFTFNGGHPPYDDYRYTEALNSINDELSFFNSSDGWAWTWGMN